jgi:hypothetical protein
MVYPNNKWINHNFEFTEALKTKLSQCLVMQESYIHAILEVATSHPGHFLRRTRNRADYRAGQDGAEKEKCLSCRESNPIPLSLSPCRGHCTD